MMKEGTGEVPPSPIRIKIDRGAADILKEHAKRRDSYRGYKSRSDAWGRGFLRNPIFVGICGEHALCLYLNKRTGEKLAVDTKLRRKGDGGRDVCLFGTAIQVKTRLSRSKANLVRRVETERRVHVVEVPIAPHVFTSFDEQSMCVDLLGWVDYDTLIDRGGLVRSPVSTHFNLDVCDRLLKPMNRLPDYCRWGGLA